MFERSGAASAGARALGLLAWGALALLCLLAWTPAAHADEDGQPAALSVTTRVDSGTEPEEGRLAEPPIREAGEAGGTEDEGVSAAEHPNDRARGHWITMDVLVRRTEPGNPAGFSEAGDAVAACAVALAGYPRTGRAVGPANKDRGQMPPDTGRGGDWTVHNKVARAISDGTRSLYAECSASVTLAVRWSGVDDQFSAGTTSQQYRYLANSPKWQRVGGKGKYFRKLSKPDAGVDVRPGDILVARESEAGKNSHIAIYVGTEYADLKYPGGGFFYFESKAADTSWTCLSRWRDGDYCVFRRTDVDLDMDGSRYAELYLDDKKRYSLSKPLVQEERVESLKVKYVYDDYYIEYAGLPEGSIAPARNAFKYNSGTFALDDPLLPEGYVFDGWWADDSNHLRVGEVEKGTMEDVVVYAHVHDDASHGPLGLKADPESLARYHVDRTPVTAALVAVGAVLAVIVTLLAAMCARRRRDGGGLAPWAGDPPA